MFPFSGKSTYPLLAIKIAASGLFFYFLYRNTDISLERFKWVWGHADPLFLAISFFIAGLLLYLNIVRWHYFMKAGGFTTTFSKSAASFMAGNLLGLVSPGRLAEFGRGYLYADYPIKETALVTLTEKFYFVFFTLLFGVAGLILGYPLLRSLPGVPVLVLSAVLLAGLCVSGWITLKGRRIAYKGLFRFFPDREPERFYLLTLTNLTYVLMILQFYFILIAFFKIKLLYAFITLSLTLIVLTFFPVSFGNLGVREGCFIYLLNASAGFPEIAALNAGFLVFLQNIFMPSVLGLIVMLAVRRSGNNPAVVKS